MSIRGELGADLDLRSFPPLTHLIRSEGRGSGWRLTRGCFIDGGSQRKAEHRVNLGIDEAASTSGALFSLVGRRLAWGNLDGTVNVADIDVLIGRLEQLSESAEQVGLSP